MTIAEQPFCRVDIAFLVILSEGCRSEGSRAVLRAYPTSSP